MLINKLRILNFRSYFVLILDIQLSFILFQRSADWSVDLEMGPVNARKESYQMRRIIENVGVALWFDADVTFGNFV